MFTATVGHISEDVIRQYTESQKNTFVAALFSTSTRLVVFPHRFHKSVWCLIDFDSLLPIDSLGKRPTSQTVGFCMPDRGQDCESKFSFARFLQKHSP
jgi:hypothetical protein